MKAARCHRYGPPHSLTVEEVPEPAPAEGQVRVRVGGASVNFPDALLVANKYQMRVEPPFTPGSDFAGTVEELGPGVSGWSVGDRVYGTVFVGAYAEQLIAPATALQRVPEAVSLAAAAAFPTVYGTAYDALRSVAELSAGETLVVLGASGGVGTAAVQIGKLLGARVLACASTEPKVAMARAAGAEEGVAYAVEPLKERLKEIAPGGVDVVLDPVGGEVTELALRAMHYGGRFVVVGFASGMIPRLPLNLVLLKGVRVQGYDVGSFLTHESSAFERNRAELWAHLAAGRLEPVVGARYPLERAADALAAVAERRAMGKVVIEP